MRHKTKNDITTCYYNARRSPSVKAMAVALKIDMNKARAIKAVLTGRTDIMTIESAKTRQLQAYNPHDAPTLALEAINELLGFYGVEYIESVDDAQGIEYCNTGDTYGMTLTYDHRDDLWRLGSWGDIVEFEPHRFSN